MKERLSEKLVLKSGAEIVCSHCRLYIGRTIENITLMNRVRSSMFTGPNITAHGESKCPRCSSSWFLPFLGRIHTREGWWPDDETMMDLREGKYDLSY